MADFEKIEGVDLSDLVTEAAGAVLSERRKQAAGMIKQLLQRVEGAASDIRDLEKQIARKRESMGKAQAKIDKLKAGDWSVLAELARQNQKG